MEKGESIDDLFDDLSKDVKKRVEKKLNEFVGRKVSFKGVMWVDKYHPLRNKLTKFEVHVAKLIPNGGSYIPYQLRLIDTKGINYCLYDECELLILD